MEQSELREQVIRQCEAVAYMARVLAGVRQDYANLIRPGQLEHLIDIVGRETAREMETLGDILNGMDAVGDETKRLAPVFEKAHQLWPTVGVP